MPIRSSSPRHLLIGWFVVAALAVSSATASGDPGEPSAPAGDGYAGSSGEAGETEDTGERPMRPHVGPTLPGIDVTSHWQNTIDWKKVAGAGKRFVFLKATDGARLSRSDVRDQPRGRPGQRAAGGRVSLRPSRPVAGRCGRGSALVVGQADPKP